MKITQNFELREFTRSITADRLGIANEPDAEALANITHLCKTVLEPFRRHLGEPLVISSGYRCPRLNAAVGGVANSQHLKGEAADIRIPRVPGTNRPDIRFARRWMDYIAVNLPFDQLILEHGPHSTAWIHVSICRDMKRNRHKVLELRKK